MTTLMPIDARPAGRNPAWPADTSDLLARVDALRKHGNVVDLIEVKAKSWDPQQDSLTGQTARSNPLDPDWEPYVYDVAFQERVLRLAYPQFTVRPWLLLVDKRREILSK